MPPDQTSGRRRPRGVLALGLLLAVAGLAIGAYGAWSSASAVGPRTSSAGTVVGLEHIAHGGRSGSDEWLVRVHWSGGSGDIDDHELFDALSPLEGRPAVVAARSDVTGDLLRVDLGGQWYAAPQASATFGVVDLGVGVLLLLAAAAVTFARGPAGRALRRLPRRALGRAGLAALVALPLAIAALGAWRVAAIVGPHRSTPGKAVAAADSYVDVTWGGGRSRLTDGDLTLAIGVNRSIATAFDQSTVVPVTIQRSSIDGSVVAVVLDGKSYEVASSLTPAIAMLVLGLGFAGGVVALLVASVRKARLSGATGQPANGVA